MYVVEKYYNKYKHQKSEIIKSLKYQLNTIKNAISDKIEREHDSTIKVLDGDFSFKGINFSTAIKINDTYEGIQIILRAYPSDIRQHDSFSFEYIIKTVQDINDVFVEWLVDKTFFILFKDDLR